MKTIKGDIVKMAESGEFDVVVHGCNCFHTFGAGVAKQIRERFPMAFEADLKTARGDREKLGTVSAAHVCVDGKKYFMIANAYTQYGTLGDKPLVDYDALRRCFKTIAGLVPSYAKIAYPKIGAGLAGGDWGVISKIIDEELAGYDHTLVEWDRGASE